jgi:ubiquinone/menaquinone biosynthesis C-methylase UbiE
MWQNWRNVLSGMRADASNHFGAVFLGSAPSAELPELPSVLDEAYRVLKPGGTVYLQFDKDSLVRIGSFIKTRDVVTDYLKSAGFSGVKDSLYVKNPFQSPWFTLSGIKR